MADGAIIFNTKIDNSNVEKDLKDLERKVRKAEETIAHSENEKLPLLRQMEDLNRKIKEATANLERLKGERFSIQNTLVNSPKGSEDYAAAKRNFPRVQAAVEAQEKELSRLQKEWDKVNTKAGAYDRKINEARETIESATTQAGLLTKKTNGAGAVMQKAFAKAKASAANFNKQLFSMAKSALVFSVITKAFEAIRNYMGKTLKANQQFTAKLRELKAALATAFQPLYEKIVPGLIVAMDVLIDVVNTLASVLSIMFGSTLAKSADAAKKLNEEADAMEKLGKATKKTAGNMAGFDEINQMSSNDSDAAAGMAFDRYTEEYKAKINELTGYLIGGLLAVGAFLAITGINIGLGVAMMIAGAATLYGAAQSNGGSLSEELKKGLAECLAVIGGALLVIGVILAVLGFNLPLGIALIAAGATALVSAAALDWNAMSKILQDNAKEIAAISGLILVLGLVLAFSGVALPLGIALIAVGAAGMAATVAANWNSIVTALQGPIGGIVALVSGALLAIGVVLLCCGAAPLGLGLIVAGVAGLVTAIAPNWNFLKEKVQSIWNGIVSWWNSTVAPVFTKKFWQNKWAVLVDSLPASIKNGINAAIVLFNKFIKWINDKMSFSWQPFYIAGMKVFDGGSVQLINIPEIPKLAKGGVIPPNAPFMAMLGDQRHGTNIEAPLETIQEAVAIVMEDMIQSNIAGHEATVGILREILGAVLGIHIGDDVIGQAVARYNSDMAIIRGGNG